MDDTLDVETGSSMNEKVPKKESKPSQPFIYRVPKYIRNARPEAYTPQTVSIGPFHYGNDNVKEMEKQKKEYEEKFFNRMTSKNREEVLDVIKNQEQNIRECYSEKCVLESEKYAEMILRDAIFIIELLLRNSENHRSDFFINTPAEMFALQLDLLLLENQLPYYLLKDLYHLLVNKPSFINDCSKFFQMFSQHEPKQEELKHFTDLYRATLVGNLPRESSTRGLHHATQLRQTGATFISAFRLGCMRRALLPGVNESFNFDIWGLPCATELQASGVTFTCASEEQRLPEISFEQGELRIPQLSVFYWTENILRNIMALEQCCYPYATIVCAFVHLLDSLIEDKRDAQLLVDKGIICNGMGDSKALANLLNKLCVEIPIIKNHYGQLYGALKKHYNNQCNRNKARLKTVYFGDIWKGTATIAAAIILVLTFIQTMYTVMQQKSKIN